VSTQQRIEDADHSARSPHAMKRENEDRIVGVERGDESTDLSVHLAEDLDQTLPTSCRAAHPVWIGRRVGGIHGVPEEMRGPMHLGEHHQGQVRVRL